jgi:hypothetical protein
MTSSGAFPFDKVTNTEPLISPSLSDLGPSAFIGKARIKDVEEKLGMSPFALFEFHLRRDLLITDAIQGLVQRLVESGKKREHEVVTRRKRHKRDTRLTAEVPVQAQLTV